MNKSTRLIQLRLQLQNMTKPLTLNEIAIELGCSEKTIRRDVQALESIFDAPWSVHQNQVIWKKPRSHVIHLDGYWFSTQELLALLAFHNTMAQLTQGVLSRELAPFKKKILQLLGKQSKGTLLDEKIKLIQKAARTVDEKVFNQIVQALHDNKRLDITYWNRSKDQLSHRQISPQQLVRYRDNWLVDAWCHEKNGIRTFALDGIKKVSLLALECQLVQQGVLQSHFENSYGIFSGQADSKVTLKFSPFIARWIQFESWHPKQEAYWDQEGYFYLVIPYSQDIELIRDILKYGVEVEVISPKILREKVRIQLEKSLEVYSRDKICP